MNTNQKADVLVIDETTQDHSASSDAAIPEKEENSTPWEMLEGGKLKVKLAYPFDVNYKPAPGAGPERTESLTEVILRRPNGEDIKAISRFSEGYDKSEQLLSRLSGLNVLIIQKMDAYDITVCAQAVETFLPTAKTGKPK